jgi:hypothetical protein
MMLKTLTIVTALAASMTLAGCGNTGGQRAGSGALIGAGGGALLGAVAGFNPLVGAAIGAGGGAIVGAASK